MIKTPFNWVGKKSKHIDLLSEHLDRDKPYVRFIDLFMGSGSLLFNVPITYHTGAGNDTIPLLSHIYQFLSWGIYLPEELVMAIYNTLEDWNWFGDKKLYYSFREKWNVEYISIINGYGEYKISPQFVAKTILLLKMCSNSMVRFNRKGEFNQGYRGCTKESFFNERSASNIGTDLLILSEELRKGNYNFTTRSFESFESSFHDQSVFMAIDPPYTLDIGSNGTGYGGHYNHEKDDLLYKLLNSASCDYVFFNYLSVGDVVNEKLMHIIENNNLQVIDISKQTSTGQKRKINKKVVKEVMVIKQ